MKICALYVYWENALRRTMFSYANTEGNGDHHWLCGSCKGLVSHYIILFIYSSLTVSKFDPLDNDQFNTIQQSLMAYL